MKIMNELLLIGSMLFAYGAVLVAWRFFGKAGLFAMTAFCTIVSNIEVMILIHAFGMEQTLGNMLFASSFVITDILSENENKAAAQKAVNLGIFISVVFILISQSWMVYRTADEGGVYQAIRTVFSNTPRIMFVSIAVYAISQRFDVWLYHKIWDLTKRKNGDSRRFLWLRNNGATLTAQLLNNVLFTFGAFLGTYSLPTLMSILASSYLIYIVTSFCDTPVVYLARKIHEKYPLKN